MHHKIASGPTQVSHGITCYHIQVSYLATCGVVGCTWCDYTACRCGATGFDWSLAAKWCSLWNSYGWSESSFYWETHRIPEQSSQAHRFFSAPCWRSLRHPWSWCPRCGRFNFNKICCIFLCSCRLPTAGNAKGQSLLLRQESLTSTHIHPILKTQHSFRGLSVASCQFDSTTWVTWAEDAVDPEAACLQTTPKLQFTGVSVHLCVVNIS